MNKRQEPICASSSFASTVVDCIYIAVGDGIKEDIARQGLKTHNSVPSRIWDLLNTYVCERLRTTDCIATTTKRGPWEIALVYDRATGFLFTLMREKRFNELQSNVTKRRNMHYVDLLVRHLNSDLVSNVGQTRLFPIYFEDEDKMAENVQKILLGFSEDVGEIKRHAIILFDSSKYNLTSVRAIMVDSNLNPVSEWDWTKYIPVQESSITEKVDNPNAPESNPSRGLELTAKAAARKKAVRKRRREENIS